WVGGGGGGVGGGILFNGSLGVDIPKIADRGHLDIVRGLVLGNNPSQFLTPAPRPDVPKGDPIVCTENPGVGYRRRNGCGPDQRRGPGQKCPTVNLSFGSAHCVPPRSPHSDSLS